MSRSFQFVVAKSTGYENERMLRWFDKYLKLNPPPVDPRAQIEGIETIKGGINELIDLGPEIMIKYIITFMRRIKPDMFQEGCDLIAECLDDKNNYRKPRMTMKFYKASSYESVISALIAGINRMMIKAHEKKMNKKENVEELEEPNLIDINSQQWIVIKQIREKIKKILFNHSLHTKLSRSNKETHTLSVNNVCRMFQNLDRLTKNCKPKV